MPIYEYKCPSCDIKFEVKRGFTESTGASCPRCQCLAQRIFSPVPIVFMGSGFYVTDNASDGRHAPGSSQKDEDKPAEKAKDSEPAAKAGEKASGSEPANSKPESPKPTEVKA
jgi:putative FmdB family regulatory protein